MEASGRALERWWTVSMRLLFFGVVSLGLLSSACGDGELRAATSDGGRDANITIMDSSVMIMDSSAADSGPPPADTGTPPADTGTPPVDSSLPAMCSGGPLALPIDGCTPTPVPDTGDIYADCVARINQFRAECQCLPPLMRWTEGESCADMHAEYDSTRPPHSGFGDRICSNGGRAQNECPGWRSTSQVISGCLQAMWDEGPGEPFSAHGHYINMSNTSYSQVACGFYTTSGGQLWAVQNFQ